MHISEAAVAEAARSIEAAKARVVTESGRDASGIGPSRHEQFIRESAEDLVDRVTRAEQDLSKASPADLAAVAFARFG